MSDTVQIVGRANGNGFAFVPAGGSVSIFEGETISHLFTNIDELCAWLKEQAKAGS